MAFSRKILLDTKFLLIPAQFNVDIFSEIQRICYFKYEVFIMDKSLKELDNIVKNQKGAQKEAAKLAISLVDFKKINIIKSETDKYVDDALLELSDPEDTLIATQDKELKERAKAKGLKVITLKQKSHLEIV